MVVVLSNIYTDACNKNIYNHILAQNVANALARIINVLEIEL